MRTTCGKVVVGAVVLFAARGVGELPRVHRPGEFTAGTFRMLVHGGVNL